MGAASMLTGACLALFGLVGVSFGSLWAPGALQFFADHESWAQLELIVPFLPILMTATGVRLVVQSRQLGAKSRGAS